MITFRALLAAVALALAVPAVAAAAPGDLDGGFDRDGLQTAPVQGPTALAVASDASSVVVSESAKGFGLHRFDAAGAPAGLLGDGRAEIDVGGATGPVAQMEPGGTLLIAGTSTAGFNRGDFVLARVAYGAAASPALDTSLDGDGIAFVHLPSFTGNELTDVSVAADGSIAAAGIVEGTEGAHVGVARLQSDGTPLPGFDTDGLVVFPEGGGFGTEVEVVALPGDETLIAAAGPAPDGSGVGDLLIARLDSGGNFDTAFGGGDGWLTIDVDGRDDARSLAVLADGRIAVGFQACAFGLHTSCRESVALLSSDGALEPGFGSGGLVVDVLGSEVADGGEGRVLVAGASEFRDHFQRDFSLTRLRTDGTPDPAFSNDGTAVADFELSEDRATAIAVDPAGRPVVSGPAGDAHGVARFEVADGPPDADADGLLDGVDRCPQRYAVHPSGCPSAERDVKLRKRRGRFEVKLKSELKPCVAAQRVRLLRLRPGRDKRVARVRTARQGKADLGRVPRPGRYRATVKLTIAPELARCEKARSKTKRVGG